MALNYDISDLSALAKTAVTSTDYIQLQNDSSRQYKKISIQTLFPSLATSGTSSESLYVSVTNSNQLNFKGIKSNDAKMTVTTASNNIVLTLVESQIDLSACDNTTSGFITGVDFTETVTGECGVVNGGTGLSTIAKGAMLYASAADTIAATSAMSTNGQILIGNATTGIPTLTTLTQGAGMTITNGAGSITLAASIANAESNIDLRNAAGSTTYNIDTHAGDGWLSNDGADGGITVGASNKAYVGASGAAQYDGILNLGGNLTFVNTVSGIVKPQATTSTNDGQDLSVEGGGSDNAAAGDLLLKGGAAGSGNNDGGDVKIYGGNDAGSGNAGDVITYVYDGSGNAVQSLTVAGGDATPDVTVNAGNLIASKGAYMRDASYPDVIKYQGEPHNTDDGTAALTAANILTGIVTCTPTADRSKATDTASNLVSGLGLLVDNDSFDFSLISLATDGTSDITLTGGTGVTVVGNMKVKSQDDADDAGYAGVGRFRIRRTGSSAVTMYRIG